MNTVPTALERPAVVVFPDAPWRSSAFASLLAPIADKHPVRWVTNDPIQALGDAPPNVTPLPLGELRQIDWAGTTAFVLHPGWSTVVLPLAPRLLGAWSASTPENNPSMAKWRSRLLGEASFALTLAEPYYMDLSFLRDNVFVLDGADETSDWFAVQAVLWAADGTDPLPLSRLQRQRREAAYRERLSEGDGGAALSFYRSVYLYLLGDGVQAERELLSAFEQAVLSGDEHALTRIYRFRSAIQAALGLTEAAVLTYETTAATDTERDNAAELRNLLQRGEPELATAMLSRLNDDHRAAAERLKRLLGQEAEEGVARNDGLAERLLVDSLLQAGRIRQAGDRCKPPATGTATERSEHYLLQGTVQLMNGNRHEAVRAYVRAAELRQEAVCNLTELASLDAGVRLLAGAGVAANTDADRDADIDADTAEPRR